MANGDCVVGGHICLDIIPEIPTSDVSFAPGKLLQVGAARFGAGGPVSNTGLALHKLGIQTQFAGKIGDDLFGEALLRLLASHDPAIVAAMKHAPGEVTSYSIILNPPGEDRMFLHCAGCNDTFGVEDIDYSPLHESRLFHFGYPPLMRRMIEEDGKELVEVYRRARATGVTTSLDMTMPDPHSYTGQVNWKRILTNVLPYVDIFIPSLEETLYCLYPEIFGRMSEEDEPINRQITPEFLRSIGRDLLTMGPAIAGLKMGDRGLYIQTSDLDRMEKMGRARPAALDTWVLRQIWSPCFKVNVAGTTGAGDATLAGFLSGLLRGLSPEETVTMGCAVGACNVEAADSLSGIRGWEETRQRIAGGWERLTLPSSLEESGFRRGNGLWFGLDDAKTSGIARKGGSL